VVPVVTQVVVAARDQEALCEMREWERKQRRKRSPGVIASGTDVIIFQIFWRKIGVFDSK
jgi:hypothetical protein